MAGRANYRWLHDAARDRRAGPGLGKVRELFLHEILVSDSALSSLETRDLVTSNVAFVNWATNDAVLIPGEFPQEALWSYHADAYLSEVNNGGHGQFVANSRWDTVSVGACERGLRAIGALAYAAIFAGLKAFIEADDARAIAVAEAGGFGPKEAGIRELDDQFFELGGTERVVEQNAAWLRTLPQLRPLDDQALAAQMERIAASNKLRDQREKEWRAYRRKEWMKDPVFQIADRLCKKVGIKIESIDGPPSLIAGVIYGLASERYVCNVPITVSGVKGAQSVRSDVVIVFVESYGFLKQPVAALSNLMAKQPARVLAITRREYDAFVPADVRERIKRG